MYGWLVRVFFALFGASFTVQLGLFIGYHGSGRPAHRQPELGRIHPSNNHGSIVYLTDKEATGQSLLTIVCFMGLFPAGFILWKLDGFGRTQGRVDDEITTGRQNALWAGMLVFFLLIIVLLGPRLVYFAVSHGWVLSSP